MGQSWSQLQHAVCFFVGLANLSFFVINSFHLAPPISLWSLPWRKKEKRRSNLTGVIESRSELLSFPPNFKQKKTMRERQGDRERESAREREKERERERDGRTDGEQVFHSVEVALLFFFCSLLSYRFRPGT